MTSWPLCGDLHDQESWTWVASIGKNPITHSYINSEKIGSLSNSADENVSSTFWMRGHGTAHTRTKIG